MEWYKRWFGEEYLLVYEHRDILEAERDTGFIERVMKLRGGERILDLCCGPGRHDFPLARRGYSVVGLDYSMPMLRIARNAVGPDAVYPCYVRADARDIPFREGVFDVVLNLFTSFGYFDDEGNRGLLRSIARLLRDGGKYYIDYLNPPNLLARLEPETVREKDGVTVIERRKVDDTGNRVEKTIILRSGRLEQVFQESVRLYTCEEMRGMLEDAGLSVEGVFGSTGGDPYGESSGRMIFWGKKNK